MPLVDFPKDLASHSLVRATDARRVITEEYSATYKWLMASFLATNGAGLLSLSELDIPKGNLVVAGVAFWLGIIGAFGVAWRGQIASRRTLGKLSRVEALWSTVLATGQLDSDEFQAIEATMENIGELWAKIFGWGSLVAFSFGLATVGQGLAFAPHHSGQDSPKTTVIESGRGAND